LFTNTSREPLLLGMTAFASFTTGNASKPFATEFQRTGFCHTCDATCM
jgi:hypothetical protein